MCFFLLDYCLLNLSRLTGLQFEQKKIHHANTPWMIHIIESDANEHIELSMWLRALVA